jgi:hypothetical protein
VRCTGPAASRGQVDEDQPRERTFFHIFVNTNGLVADMETKK